MTAPVNHPENGTNLRYGGQQADGDITAALIKTLQDLRCPDADRTKCVGQAEIRQGIHHHHRSEDLPPHAALLHGVVADGSLWLNQRQTIVIHHLLQAFFVFFRQPLSFVR